MPRPEPDALDYLYDRFIGDDPERIASYENARTNAIIATAIYELRTQAKLSQRALAERVGTTASVICRLEDSDYDGHSLTMLRRVAAALGQRVEIRFTPEVQESDKAATPDVEAAKPRPKRFTGGSYSIRKDQVRARASHSVKITGPSKARAKDSTTSEGKDSTEDTGPKTKGSKTRTKH